MSDGGCKLRAVKEERKIAPGLKSMDYSHELEAIAKFSQEKVAFLTPILCFAWADRTLV